MEVPTEQFTMEMSQLKEMEAKEEEIVKMLVSKL